MSSDSELDEYFDVEDSTPGKMNRGIEQKASNLNDPTDYDVEKQRILDQIHNAELRRRKEEEELRLQLVDLDAKRDALKKAEVDASQVQEQDARFKKLADFRTKLATPAAPDVAPTKPPRMFLYSDDEDENTTLTKTKKKKDQSNATGVGPQVDTGDSEGASGGAAAEGDDPLMSSGSSEEFKTLPRALSMDEQFRDALSGTVSGSDGTMDDSSSADDDNASGDEASLADQLVQEACASGLVKSEPDIIRSTKNSLDLDTGLGPIAPPRRKRKTKADHAVPPTILESSTNMEGAMRSVLCDDLSASYNSTLGHITKDLEHSLDLQSATSGSRIVTAQEDDSAKADALSDSASSISDSAKCHKDDTSSTDTLTPLASPHQNEALTPITSSIETTTVKDNPSALCGQPTGNTSPIPDPEVIEAISKNLKTNSLEKDKIFIKRECSDGEIKIKAIPRPRTNSGSRFMTDLEILEGVQVLNLDTGEQVLLSEAEDKIPTCANPLSLHIMRRTQEYSSDSSLHKGPNVSDDEGKEASGINTIRTLKQPTKRRKTKLKEMFGKTVHKIKSVADEVLHHEEVYSDDDEEVDCRKMIKVKAANAHKGPYDFDLLVPIQELGGEHLKAVWCMKFSHCGKLLATGGQDNKLRVWVLKDAFAYFEDMRQKYNEATKVSPTPSQDSLSSQSSDMSRESEATGCDEGDEDQNPFMKKPFCIYKGHTADLLDLSWSKNYFILTSSMDKMVRLWHISRKECLCCFQHIDFVTAIAFHPKDDRYFLSGSLDGKLRMWSIPDKKVALWNEVQGQTKLITAANFCLHGRFAVVGTYDGRCIFYSTDKLKYHTQIHVRSTRGRNARGRKITGVDPLPGGDKVLVTSNDSRIRLYDLRDLTLTCKYRGCSNNSSQIKASFSQNGKYIICGSEDHFVYVWRTQHDFYKMSSARKDRNIFWEGIKAHAAVVTVAIFAPNPGLIIKPQFARVDSDDKDEVPAVRGEVLVSADFSGNIRVFINKFKPGSGV